MPFGIIAGVLGVAGAVLGAKGQRDAGRAQADAQRYKAQVDNANAQFQQENNAALSRYKTLLDNRYDYTSTLAANQQATADAKGQIGLDFDRARITGALEKTLATRSAGELTASTARNVALGNRLADRSAGELVTSAGRSAALGERSAGRSADLGNRLAGRSAGELTTLTGREVALNTRLADRSAGELTETAQSRAKGTLLGASHTIDQLQLEQATFTAERRLELQNFTEEVQYNASVENAGQHHKARLLEFGADVARQEQVHTQQAAEQQLLNDGRAAAAAMAQNAVSGASRGVAVDEGTQKKIADDIAALSNEAQMDVLAAMDREIFGLEADAIGAEKEAEFARFMGASALYKADLAVSHRSSETNLAINNREQLTSQRSNAVREMANYESSEAIRLASMQAANIRASAADRGRVATANAATRAANIRADAADRGAVARADAADRGAVTRADAADRAANIRATAADRGAVATADAAARASNIIASASDKARADQELTQSRARERLASTSRSNIYRTELTNLKAQSRSSMSEFEIARAAEMQKFVAEGRTSLANKGAAISESTGKLNAIGTLIGAAGSVANQWHAYQVGA